MNFYCDHCKVEIPEGRTTCRKCWKVSDTSMRSREKSIKKDRERLFSARDEKQYKQELAPVKKQKTSKTEYALIHTLGRCKLDDLGGDGAYANWMDDYFRNARQADGCQGIRWV